MTDVMKVAVERRTELARQVDELDEFIRMAQLLLKQRTLPLVAAADEPDSDDEDEDDDISAAAETETETDAEPEAEARPTEEQGKREAMLANAPWKNMVPPRPRGSSDDSGPTRVNLFRRELPAAG